MNASANAYMLLMLALTASLLAGCATPAVQTRLDDGIAAYKHGDVASFITDTKEAYRMNPNDPYVSNDMGIVYQLEGNKDAALASYKKAYETAGDRLIWYSQLDKDLGRPLKAVAQENYQNLCSASGGC